MKTIGIKLADGTFYPVLEEDTPKKRMLDLTTAKDGQTKVQIDLYRSESGSMADAEYVDTLEVSNMVPHPNGEPELHLSLGLDENNNLSAEVVDPETGKKSETKVNLVSQTLVEKANPSDFAPTLKEPDGDENNDKNKAEDSKDSKTGSSALAAAGAVAAAPTSEDFSFDDFADDTLAEEEENGDEPSDFPDLVQDDPANLDPSSADNALAPEDLPEIKADTLEDMPFSFDNSEVFPSDHSKTAETSENGSVDELGIADNTLEGMDFGKDAGKEDVNEEKKDENTPDPNESDADSDKTVSSYGAGAASNPDTTGIDFSDLPDFDDSEFSAKENSSGEKAPADQSDIEAAFDTSALDNFDTSDLDASLDSLGDSSTDGKEKAGYTSGSAMDFSDLYDKETMNGEHATVYDDEEKKKTRAPVVICIVCAIICVLATILVLFVVPSKYNLIKSRNTRNMEKPAEAVSAPSSEPSSDESLDNAADTQIASQSEKLPEETPAVEEPPAEETAPKAEEDKIVVAPEPEKVVPEPAPKPEKKPDVKYHIRWGDTLWDLSESYYKNPWKYPKIANYNNIKNPDLIISGTDILIPAE